MMVTINMTIPDTCSECRLSVRHFGKLYCPYLDGRVGNEGNDERCPLVDADDHNAEVSKKGDLISRQMAIDLVRDVCDAIMSGCESWYDPGTGDEVYKDILEVDAILKCNKEVRIALRNMPTVQPEREKGKWIKPTGMMPPEYKGVYRCSECGEIAMRDWKRHYQTLTNYCPNCGCRMLKEGEEHD